VRATAACEGAGIVVTPCAFDAIRRAEVGVAFAGVLVAATGLAAVGGEVRETTSTGLGASAAGHGAGGPGAEEFFDAISGAGVGVADLGGAGSGADLAAVYGLGEDTTAGAGTTIARGRAAIPESPDPNFAVNRALVVVARLVLTIFKTDLTAVLGILGGTGAELTASFARFIAHAPLAPAEVLVVGETTVSKVTVQAILGAFVEIAILNRMSGDAALAAEHGFCGETGASLGGFDVTGILEVGVIGEGARCRACSPGVPGTYNTIDGARMYVAFT